MNFILKPWQLFLLILSGWVNHQQQEIIEFQNAQIQALLDKIGRKRILLTDDQRRVLAVKGKALGRKTMMELTTIVTPDTILRWHRRLIAEKWDYSERRRNNPGSPPVPMTVRKLILRMARENPTWGYDRNQGALANLGHEVSDSTVGKILKHTALADGSGHEVLRTVSRGPGAGRDPAHIMGGPESVSGVSPSSRYGNACHAVIIFQRLNDPPHSRVRPKISCVCQQNGRAERHLHVVRIF